MNLREDRNLVALAHLSQLINFVTGFGGFVIPLVLWLTQKDKVFDMDSQGKQILNFQISTFILTLFCVPAILLFGLGVLGLLILAVLIFIFPIINAIKAINGEHTYYPLSYQFLT